MIRFALLVLLAPTVAHAGYCLDDIEKAGEVKRLEELAKSGKSDQPMGPAVLECALAAPNLRPRVDAVCTKLAVMSRADQNLRPVIDGCVDHLVAGGTTKVGAIALADKIMTRAVSWSERPTLRILATTRDPRARAFILDKLREVSAKIGKQKMTGWRADAYRAFRIDALGALERVGIAADAGVIDELLAASKDPTLVAAAAAAHAAASKR